MADQPKMRPEGMSAPEVAKAEAEGASPTFGIEFYHQAVFRYFEQTFHNRIREALLTRSTLFRDRAFLDGLSREQEYSGQDAWDRCYDYLGSIEAEMATVLRRHSVFFWIHLYRRIGVQLASFHGGRTDATTLGLVRQISELALSKHADLDRHDDMALSSEIHFKDVLGGHYQRLWTKWIGAADAGAKFRALADTKQWVITQFELRDYLEIYAIEGFAYEYWRTTALMRAIGKGSGFVLRRDADWPDNVASAEFRRLIRSYDTRIEHTPFSTALLGSWFDSKDDGANRKNIMLVPSYNVERLPGTEALKAFGSRPVIDSFVPNFIVGRIDIIAFRNAHSFLADAFMKATDVSLDTYLVCLWALSNIVLLPTRVLSASDVESGFLDPKGPMFLNFLNIIQRAYILFSSGTGGIVDDVLLRSSVFGGELPNPPRDQATECISQLLLSADKRDQIGLWSGGRRFPLIPFRDALVIDLQGVPSLLNSMFYRIQYEQTVRGSVFEEAFRTALKAANFDQPHIGEVVTRSGEKREIDTSVRIADQLILFECRSIERPLDYELGRPRTIEARNKFLEEKIYQALSLRDFVIANPVGRNYDFSWARSISAFVVSPFIEWIWDVGPHYWDDGDIPRVLQADEAISFLRQLSGKTA